MAQKRRVAANEPILPPKLIMSREEATIKLQDRIDKGRVLFNLQLINQTELEEAEKEKDKWTEYNSELLQRMFDNLTIANEYTYSYAPTVIRDSYNYSFYNEANDFRESLQTKLNKLESILDRLDLIPEANPSKNTISQDTIQQNKLTNNIFVVHGQDEGAKETLARNLSKLNLNPIILHEQPNEGKTIIEKFENHASSVGYAVVLMTPDDIGYPVNRTELAKARARQNVIFELGYFIGKLSRNRVCALYKEGVEIPSDYQGVIFIKMDENSTWKFLLAKELKSAGYSIDLNSLL